MSSFGGTGHPWGEEERAQWRASRVRHRSYRDDVVAQIEALSGRFERIFYGELRYADDVYPLYALRSRVIDAALPNVLVTGGVHGYETSGVLGALAFLDTAAGDYAGRANMLVAPCISPWAYERIQRWNYDAIDPNRNFRSDGPLEATCLIDVVRSFASDYLVHVDLHETTDSDRTEFRPALSARDGKPFEDEEIPDGFYLVADSADQQLEFQQAIIAEVEKVTHIAPADAKGEIIGSAARRGAPPLQQTPFWCTALSSTRSQRFRYALRSPMRGSKPRLKSTPTARARRKRFASARK